MLPLVAVLVLGVLAQQTFADEPEAIVGGMMADPGQFPHQVSLRTSYGSHFCGGSIVSKWTIVTAAHCTQGLTAKGITVVVGSLRSNSGGVSHKVREIIEHPEYVHAQKASWKNDMCLLILETPLEFNAYVQPIKLATVSPKVGKPAITSGWGYTRANGRVSPDLLWINTYIVSRDKCAKDHYGQPLGDSHLCAYKEIGRGACQGDSGGPLTVDDELVGVTSWVLPCALGRSDVYCNVAAMKSFWQPRIVY
ncbi:Trypsin epsilon [Harpegnathos saltator]|uniref:chymotrypsin n=3 Tax=Harpegnathos saltator TaxID=610380 RepID=E2C0V1_HARSA|nr:Trypsin epsilon [Harpegnathos saltator]